LQRKRRRRKVQEFIIVDETLVKVGSQYVCVWVAIEPLAKVLLVGIRISFERRMLWFLEPFKVTDIYNKLISFLYF
jgi:putative transposase